MLEKVKSDLKLKTFKDANKIVNIPAVYVLCGMYVGIVVIISQNV